MNFGAAILMFLLGLMVVLVVVPLIRKFQALSLAREFHQTHGKAISRLGGIALALAFLCVAGVTVIFFSDHDNEKLRLHGTVILGAMLMFGLGLWDDLRQLGAKRKLFGQILISLLICGLGLGISRLTNPFNGETVELGNWGMLVTVAWLVAMTNLINLIDGIDGLAGGIGLMLMGLLAYVGWQTNSFPVLCCGVAGSLVGFLRYNFPPAKIYMGDGGAYFLGFLIGELTIVSSHKGTVMAALIAPLFVLALPILDVSLAILRRGLKGLPVFRPDRQHIHHRLIEMGLSRRRAVLWMYGFTVFFLALGFVVYSAEGRWLPVFVGVAVVAVLLAAGRLDFAREWFAVGRVLGNSLNMREEVNYAMALSRWLCLEGRRVHSVEEFWKAFVFVGERLGFSEVKLQLKDGVREWRRPKADEEKYHGFHFAKFDFSAGGAGVLELRAQVCPACQRDNVEEMIQAHGPVCVQSFERHGTTCIGDRRVFAVISELFAESWHKASRPLGATRGMELEFSGPDHAKTVRAIRLARQKSRPWFKRWAYKFFA
jgi:UDP-GlcNAc:undecaprenyl-phosphate GlcNAc-1-phosphate transferase